MPRRTPQQIRPRARFAALLIVLAAVSAISVAPAAADPTALAPQVIDSSGLLAQPSGLSISIARDGTGGLVYLRRDPGSGNLHAYLSRLIGGTFQPAVALDGNLTGSASQPVIAAGNDGQVLVAFVNGGTLYTVTVPDAAQPVPGAVAFAASATSPSLSESDFGKAYMVYTVPDGSGTSVRAAFLRDGTWNSVSGNLNAGAGDDAGAAGYRPVVVTGGDGVGVAVWGEQGHILSRRIIGTTLSTVTEQADAPLPGCRQLAVANPAAGTQGDSDYVVVAWQETVGCGSDAPQIRAVLRRLRGTAYDALTPADGITSGGQGAERPTVAMGEYGRGFVTVARTDDHSVLATPLAGNGYPVRLVQVNAQPNASAPFPVPALAGLLSNFIVFAQAPGASGTAEVRLRYAQNGITLGPELVLSRPADGPVSAENGLVAAGDVQGNAAAAWVQGTPDAPVLLADQLLQPPGAPVALLPYAYTRSSAATLTWRASNENWGPVTYGVTLDGLAVGQTTGTSVTLPGPVV